MKPSKALFWLGVALIIAGLGWLLTVLVVQTVWQRPLLNAALDPNAQFRSQPVSLLQADRGRIGVELEVTSRYAARRFYQGQEPVDLYQIPIHYRVLDAQGQELRSQWVLLDPARSELLRIERRPKSHPETQWVEAVFDVFPAPAQGPVTVELEVHPDRVYQAQVESARVMVFRQLPPLTLGMAEAVSAIGGGLLVILLALLLELRWGLKPRPVAQRWPQAGAGQRVPQRHAVAG